MPFVKILKRARGKYRRRIFMYSPTFFASNGSINRRGGVAGNDADFRDAVELANFDDVFGKVAEGFFEDNHAVEFAKIHQPPEVKKIYQRQINVKIFFAGVCVADKIFDEKFYFDAVAPDEFLNLRDERRITADGNVH